MNSIFRTTDCNVNIANEGVAFDNAADILYNLVVKYAKINLRNIQPQLPNAIQGILSTINLINHTDYRETNLVLEEASYPLESYEVSQGFDRFLLPRRVAVSTDFRAQDLSISTRFGVRVMSKDATADLLTPAEFKEEQRLVMSVFKKELTGLVKGDSRAFAQLDSVGALATSKGVSGHVPGGPILPVFTTLPLYRDSYYVVPIEEYVYERFYDLMSDWTK